MSDDEELSEGSADPSAKIPTTNVVSTKNQQFFTSRVTSDATTTQPLTTDKTQTADSATAQSTVASRVFASKASIISSIVCKTHSFYKHSNRSCYIVWT